LTAYEADKEALTAQFDAAEALLKEMQASTVNMHSQLETQRVKVDAVVDNLNRAVEDMRSGEQEVRDEMREIRSEVNNMQQMLPKVGYISTSLAWEAYRNTNSSFTDILGRCWTESRMRRQSRMQNSSKNSSQ
jgi:chromosome segregation ATPase